MLNKSWFAGLLVVALGVWFALGAANLYYGELNQDEGWYLYTARLAAEGQQPYRDFAFTQGPVFLMVYAQAQPLVERWGLMGGRIFTGGLGLVAILLGGWLAARLAPARGARPAAAIAVILLACNVYHSYFSLVVKTYSLCALFIMAGGLCMTDGAGRPRFRAALFAGLFFALAAGVRLSAGIWLPVAGLYLLWRRSDIPRAWYAFGIGGGLGLLIAFGPSIFHAPHESWFWLVQYHAARDAGAGWGALIYKAGFLSRFLQAYYVPALILLVLCAVGWKVGLHKALSAPAGALWAGGILLSVVHLAAPFPYEDYQVLIMPLFSALLASALVHGVQLLVHESQQQTVKPVVVLIILLAAIAAAISSPLNQAWVLRERDRIWWRLKDQPDLVLLQDTANRLNELRAEGEDLLLTQDTYLAVETGMRVPQGMEMGPFSYYPEWTRDEAERRRVLNREMMIDLLETTEARWAAFSGYGLAISSPEIIELSSEERAELWARVEERYERVKAIPHFGQAHTPLEIWTLRHPNSATLNPEP